MSSTIQENKSLSVERIQSLLSETIRNKLGEDATLVDQSVEVQNYDEFFTHIQMHDEGSIGDIQVKDIKKVKPYVVDQLQIVNKNTMDVEGKFHYDSSEEGASSSVTETSWTFSVAGFAGVAAQGALAAIGASATKQVKDVSGLFKRNLSGNSVEFTCKVPKNTRTVMKKKIHTTKKRVKCPLKVSVPANFQFTCSYQYQKKQKERGSKRAGSESKIKSKEMKIPFKEIFHQVTEGTDQPDGTCGVVHTGRLQRNRIQCLLYGELECQSKSCEYIFESKVDEQSEE